MDIEKLKQTALEDMHPGMLTDLRAKINAGAVKVPVDALEVALSVWQAFQSVSLVAEGVKKLGITIEDLKTVVKEVCSKAGIEVL